MVDYSDWDRIYGTYPLEELGWELGKPRSILVEYMQRGLLSAGRALDTCCGTGTNTIYLAQNRLEVTGIDVSKTAIGIAKQKAQDAGVSINFLVGSFIDLSFCDGVFDLVWDMGCFHHVAMEERPAFIAGVHRVLKPQGTYMLTCFSSRNGSRWNHFTRQQLIDLFVGYFEFCEFQHYPSLEGDGVVRYFYTVLMHKK